jgi:hypothetical protein
MEINDGVSRDAIMPRCSAKVPKYSNAVLGLKARSDARKSNEWVQQSPIRTCLLIGSQVQSPACIKH